MAKDSADYYEHIETDAASLVFTRESVLQSSTPETESRFSEGLNLGTQIESSPEFHLPDQCSDEPTFANAKNVVTSVSDDVVVKTDTTKTDDLEHDLSGDICEKEQYWQDEDGDTLLHMYILAGNKHMCLPLVLLMSETGQLDIANDLFQTPLHLAAITNQPEIAQILVDNGASVVHRDVHGRTPLHIACEHDNINMLKTLLSNEELLTDSTETRNPLDFPNYEGETCLHLATKKGDTAMVELILSKGGDVNVADGKSKRTALHMAAESGDVKMVTFLLQHGSINVNVETMDADTPIVLAFLRDRDDIVEVLEKVTSHEMKFKEV